MPGVDFERSNKLYPMLQYPWVTTRAALTTLAAQQSDLASVQTTDTNPETGGHARNILGFYAQMLRPGQVLTLPVRSPAMVFHGIKGAAEVQVDATRLPLDEADTACAPGYSRVMLRNRRVDAPSFLFIADETPLHRKLGVFQNRG